MTDDERRNRNPAVEIHPLNLADAPVIAAQHLRRYHVYILQSASGKFASLNFSEWRLIRTTINESPGDMMARLIRGNRGI